MIKEIIKIIDEIVKYGTCPNLIIEAKEVDLERNLVELYSMQFMLTDKFDSKVYPNFNRTESNIRKNIESNFPDFGFYKTILNINDFEDWNDIGTGDAVDDLHDIIIELLETKWRLENNSHADGIWYLKFAFNAHFKEHILDLLKYLHELEQM